MLRRIRHQAILLDRFWTSVRNDPRRRTVPPAGLNPEIADLAVRLSAESRSLAPTAAFRTELRERIEAAPSAPSQLRAGTSLAQDGRELPDTTFVAGDERVFEKRHPAAEWARLIAAALAFFFVGGMLVMLLGDTYTYESHTGSVSVTRTPTTDPALGASLPPGLPVQIDLNSGRPSWGMAIGAGSIWIGTVTDDGSAVVRAAQTGRLGGDVQATIPLPGYIWDVAYGHGSVWATIIGDGLTGEGSALVRIDPATNAVTATIRLGAQPTEILIYDDSVWVTDLGEPAVWRVDPVSNAVIATIELDDPGDGEGVALAISGDDLWASVPRGANGVNVLLIDPATNTASSGVNFPASENITGVAAATRGTLWMATATNVLLRINVWTGEVVDRIKLPGFPRAFLADDDYIWVATMAWSPVSGERVDGWRNALTLIDVPSGRIHTIHDLYDDVPYTLAVGGDDTWGSRVWISLNSEENQQARLRGEMRPSGISFDTTPPTATADGVVATAVASPPATPSPTRAPATSTPGPSATPPTSTMPAGAVTATYEFVGGLGMPVWGAGALWVPNFTAGVIERIDGATGETTRVEISRPGGVIDGVWIVLAADDSAVWASDNAVHELVRIDPTTYEVVARIPLGQITQFPASIESIAVGEGAVWVILDDQEVVVRIDPASNTVAAVIDVPGANSIVAGLGAVWVQNVWTAEILRIDPATNGIVATIPTGPNQFNIMSMAISGGSLWVEGSSGSGSIHQIDPETNEIVASLSTQIEFEPGHIAADDSAIWAAYEISSLVARIDLLTHDKRTLDISVPHYVAIGGGSVWVTTAAGSPNTVVRMTPET
jgi:virginiamycin B lyase